MIFNANVLNKKNNVALFEKFDNIPKIFIVVVQFILLTNKVYTFCNL